jgi:hypothetical protein
MTMLIMVVLRLALRVSFAAPRYSPAYASRFRRYPGVGGGASIFLPGGVQRAGAPLVRGWIPWVSVPGGFR